jgi:hypothetical protein
MKCPRCGNEWDTNKGSCSRCGYVIRMTGKPGGSAALSPDPFSLGNLAAGGFSAEKQHLGDSPNAWQQSSGQAPTKKQSGDLPTPWQQSAGQSPVRQQSGDLPSPWQQSSGQSSAKRQSGGLPGSPQQPDPVTPVNQPLNGFPTLQQQSGLFPTIKQQYGDMPAATQQPAGRQQSGGLSSPSSSPRPVPPQASVPPRTSNMASNTAFASDSALTKPAFEKNSLHRMPSEKEFDPRSSLQQTWSPTFDAPSMKNSIPHTPPMAQPFEVNQSINTSRPDMNYRQSQPLPPLSTGDPFTRDAQNMRTPRPSTTPQQLTGTPAAVSVKSNTLVSGTRPLLPGVLLRGGRYRLQELIERQDWLSGVFEATWIGKDSRRGGSQVMICEVVLPENTSVMTQSILRTATMALASVGRHPHIPTLWDAFSDQGRSFFVFEPIDGESLLSRVRHSGRTLTESEVIECCLQMTEVLELLAQQSPPMVHGLIRPEHVIMARNGAQFVLTNFSVVLAGGATQFITGMDRSRLSPYTAPEFVRGVIDVRTDMYSLIATAYHAITGSVPGATGGTIPSAQRLNSNVSAEFDAILTKGLRTVTNQRYQRPSELRQDLLAMRSVSGTLVTGNNVNGPGSRIAGNTISSADLRYGQHSQYAAPRIPDTVAEALPIRLTTTADDDEEQTLLPRPEDLPPMRASNDNLNATFWLGLITVALVIITVLSQVQH